MIPENSKFFNYIDFLLLIEGGNNDKIVHLDPGGMTNHGVTFRMWKRHINRYATHSYYLQERWFKFHGVNDKGFVFFDIKKFTTNDFRALQPSDVKFFYFKEFWERIKADDLPLGIDYYLFDFTVHSGQGNAVKTLQRIVSTFPDGGVGAKTIGAVEKYVKTNGTKRLLKEFDVARRNFLSQTTAGKLWAKGMDNRLKKVMSKCYEIIDDVYIDTRKPLESSRTIRASSSEVKFALAAGAGGLVAPEQSDLMSAMPKVIENLETLSTVSSIIKTLYSYGWMIPVCAMLLFAAYHAYLRIDDWFKNR